VSIVELCIRLAAHRWRLEPGADQVREWQGELHELAVEEGAGPVARAYRRLRFALSLAVSRPVPPPGAPARDWLDRPAGLLRVLRPVLILLGVPIGAVALTWASAPGMPVAGVVYLPASTALMRAVYLFVAPAAAFVLARWTGRHEPLLATVRPAVRAVAVPVLLAVGVVVVYDRPYGARTGSPHAPAAVMVAVAAWTLAAVALGLWLARMPSRPRVAVRALTAAAAVAALVVGNGADPLLVVGNRADPLVVALVAATVFAAWCAPPEVGASSVGPAPAGRAAAGPSGAGVARWTGLAGGLAGAAILAATLIPGVFALSDTAALQWTGWLDGIRQTAALLTVLGLLLAAVTWSPARRPADRRRKAAAGLAVVAAYCPASLFAMGGWHVIAEPAPDKLAAATAAVTGLLAALAAAGAVAARQAPLRPRTAAVLVAGVGLGVAALGSQTNGNGDLSTLVAIAGLLGQLSSFALVLMVWRVARGRPPHRLRRTLLWTAAWLAVVLTGAAGVPARVAGFVGRLPADDPRDVPEVSVSSTLVVAVAVAVLLAARLVRTRPAAPDPA
jgi:hypothetical protein